MMNQPDNTNQSTGGLQKKPIWKKGLFWAELALYAFIFMLQFVLERPYRGVAIALAGSLFLIWLAFRYRR